jgi:hypothetical protein
VQPEGNGCHFVSGFFQQQRRHRRVHPAAHRRHDALAAVRACPFDFALDEHLARLAVQVVLEGLVQRVQNERQRVLLAQRQRSTQGAL